MSAKVIYIAGVPASGKTTLFKRIRQELFTSSEEVKHGKCRAIKSDNYIMLGVFDGSTFEGTDRLSMAVIDDAIDYIQHLDDSKVVFVEGDRLFNFRFLQAVRAKIILLDAHPDVLKQRHQERGDNQTATFLQSRRTKLENFASKHRISRVYNNTPEDGNKIYDYIIKLAKSYVENA